MILPGFETAERFPECQVPDHVHGEEVQPVGHVHEGAVAQGVGGDRVLIKLGDERVCMVVDQRVLRSKGVFCEGVAHETADTGMELGVTRRDEVISLAIWCCLSQYECEDDVEAEDLPM